MGARGPAPVPTKTLEARGSWRGAARRKAGEPVDALSAQVPAAPAGLSKGARAEWRRVAPLLAAMRTVTLADRAVLVGYCEYYDAWVTLMRARDELTDSGEPRFPLGFTERRRIETAAKEAYGAWMAAAAKLGFSPSDRSRVREVGVGDGARDDKPDKSRFFAQGAAGGGLRIAGAG